MTIKERLSLWALGLLLLVPLCLLPLLGRGGIVIDIIASAIFLSAIAGVIVLITAARKSQQAKQLERRLR